MPRATLQELRIEEDVWGRGTPERRYEWRLAIGELIEEAAFDLPGGAAHAGAGEAPADEVPMALGLRLRAVLKVADARLVMELRDDAGALVAEPALPRAAIEPLVDEYMATCEQMARLGLGSNSPRLESLDIAKRLTHDEAGEVIVTHLRAVGADHATARRLFTLVVTLLRDTTALAARPHRFHR